MLDFAIGTQIYLAPGITDLRKSFNGLAAIVKLRFKLDPYSKCMFAFCNRNRNLIKILQWDGSGLWLFMKRLDKGNFRWPTNASEVKRISIKELRWLLEGLSIEHRGGYHPKKYLSEYSGYLTTDGYQAYHALDSRIVVSGCFSHARRKFDECLKSVPEKDRKGTTADEAIKRIGLLYKIEALLKDKSPEKRYEEQLKQSKPVLDAYFQ